MANGLFGGGSGIITNPYIIEDLLDLNAIRNNLSASYKLTNNIDATDTINWNNGKGWIPIGTSTLKFNGNIFGNGKKISNLYINRPTESYVGLFGHISPTELITIKDLGFENANISGNTYVGVLCGLSDGDSGGEVVYSNCYSNNHACHTTYRYIGGLFGIFRGVSGKSSTLENCFSIGQISAIDSTVRYMGGLIGQSLGYINIFNSFASNTFVSGNNTYKGAVIANQSTGFVVENTYYNTDLFSTDKSSYTIPLTTVQMKTQSSFGFDFDNVWIMRNDSFPELRVFTTPQEPSTAPLMTVVNSTTQRISANIGKDICTVTFVCNQNLTKWEARADGTGQGSGLLVGNGGALLSGEEATFEVENEELTLGDKIYRINVYGQNEQGVWSVYE